MQETRTIQVLLPVLAEAQFAWSLGLRTCKTPPRSGVCIIYRSRKEVLIWTF